MPAQTDISMPPMVGTNDAALRAEIARLTASLADARGEMPIPDSREVERVPAARAALDR